MVHNLKTANLNKDKTPQINREVQLPMQLN